jgi:hypothetical protein
MWDQYWRVRTNLFRKPVVNLAPSQSLIAIMLGRLRMSVDDAIQAYLRLSEGIFSEKKWWWKEGRFKASSLERAINVIVGEKGIPDTRAGQSAGILRQEQEERNADIGRGVKMIERDPGPNQCQV